MDASTDLALTARQREVLACVRELSEQAQGPPTLDSLCRALGLRSRGSLHKHIAALAEAGLVEPARRRRGVRLRRPAASGTELPYLGRIAAGRPLEALSTPETLTVPDALRGSGPCYVLRVQGDSMVDAGILDGDWVVIEQRETARNGDIVVALVDGAEATLKRIEQHPGRTFLHPANAAMAPLQYAPDRVRIQGVLVGQMRRY